MLRFIAFTLCLLPASGFLLQAQVWESFDSPTLPNGWQATGHATIQTDSSRSLLGERSLRWQWTGPDHSVEYNGPIGYSASGIQVFSFWIYLPEPMPEAQLRIDFLQNDGYRTGFDFNLNFTGWRTAFVPFRDMDGSASTGMNKARFQFTGSTPETGEVFLEQIVFSKAMDSRHQYPDLQVPFVREGLLKTRWEPLISELGLNPLDYYDVNAEEIQSAEDLVEAWQTSQQGNVNVNESRISQITNEINAFGLKDTDDGVRGNHIFFVNYPVLAYPPDLRTQVANDGLAHDFRRYGQMQLDIARSYHNTSDPGQRQFLREKFILSARHLLDQGWAEGSSQGTIHHFGYQAREYFVAHFLMRDVLEEAGILSPVRAAIQWYSRAGHVLDPEVTPDLDYYNTMSIGLLLGLLLEEDPELRAAWVKAFSNSLSHTLAMELPGDGLGLKPDGTAFHHNGHYPAYAIGAFSTLGQLFSHLQDTAFEPSAEAHAAFRNALLASRIYSHTFDWPTGISGRHPFSGDIRSLRNAFQALAAYPHPVCGSKPDPEVSAAFLRLWGNPGGMLGQAIQSAGIEVENPQGLWSFPFANHAVVRRGNWMASLKGYSRYVWASEIYSADNRYGRYQSHGTIEIYHQGGREASGFRQNGWDWNRMPGTTTVHLPLEQLESPLSGTLMLRSSETFAGTVVMNGDTGAFGLILNEDYFGDGLKARKSVIVLPYAMVALGSGLNSSNTQFPLETTLFQTSLSNLSSPQFFSHLNEPVNGFNLTGQKTTNEGMWLLDVMGNGYWLAPGSELHWHRKSQQSRHNKTKTQTSGNFSTAWLNHGIMAENAGYHFAVFPDTDQQIVQSFHTAMQDPHTAPYSVLIQNNSLHAVKDNISDVLYLVAFEAFSKPDLPWIESVDTPSLMIIHPVDDVLQFVVTNPDLNPSETGHPPSPVSIVVEGEWTPDDAEELIHFHRNGKTHLVVPTRMGESFEFRLLPALSSIGFDELPRAEHLTSHSLHMLNPISARLDWFAPNISNGLGWVIEKQTPHSAGFQLHAILKDDDRFWFDQELEPNQLAAYRISRWTKEGIGPSGPPIPVYLADGTRISYEFFRMENLNAFWQDGWIAEGIANENSDLVLTPDGLMLTDNDPLLPASIRLAFNPELSGEVRAELGVFRMANFLVTLAIMHDNQVLSEIQLTSRTQGYIQGNSRRDFTDASWDLNDGPAREVSMQWKLISENQFQLTSRFLGLAEQSNETLVEEFDSDLLPNGIRISVGFGSAVNRGGWIRSLYLATSAPSPEVPWSAFVGDNVDEPNFFITSQNGQWTVDWRNNPAPWQYGLQLSGEASYNMSEWFSITPQLKSEGEQHPFYLLPDFATPSIFYRFTLQPGG